MKPYSIAIIGIGKISLDQHLPVIAKDPRFADYFTRSKHISELYGLVGQAAATKTTQEWLDALKPLSIPVVKTNRLDDLPDDPHLKAVDFFQTYDHPDLGHYRQMRPPVNFSRTPANIRRHPPKMGEHTGRGWGGYGRGRGRGRVSHAPGGGRIIRVGQDHDSQGAVASPGYTARRIGRHQLAGRLVRHRQA